MLMLIAQWWGSVSSRCVWLGGVFIFMFNFNCVVIYVYVMSLFLMCWCFCDVWRDED